MLVEFMKLCVFYHIHGDIQPLPPHNVNGVIELHDLAQCSHDVSFLPSLYGADGTFSGRALAAKVSAESVSNTDFNSL